MIVLVILVYLSEPGVGAKQEQRLFRDLPELLSTAGDGPVMCRGFSISAGQQSVEGTVKLTLIMIYFADANTKCGQSYSTDSWHFVFASAK
jgi:hypothetical protein